MNDTPLRFKWPNDHGTHPNGRKTEWSYGVYFPATDLVVTDMGRRGTGKPEIAGIIWLDTDPSPAGGG